jgi:hypothetical protein
LLKRQPRIQLDLCCTVLLLFFEIKQQQSLFIGLRGLENKITLRSLDEVAKQL